MKPIPRYSKAFKSWNVNHDEIDIFRLSIAQIPKSDGNKIIIRFTNVDESILLFIIYLSLSLSLSIYIYIYIYIYSVYIH